MSIDFKVQEEDGSKSGPSSPISKKSHPDGLVTGQKLTYVMIRSQSMISLMIGGKERVCLAQISNTLLKKFSYNEIHNRRVALGINCK
jgi:hypothetical protein